MFNNNNEELIDNYLLDLLTPIEQASFEKQLKQDEELQKQVIHKKAAIRTFQKADILLLQENIEAARLQLLQDDFFNIRKNTARKPSKRRVFSLTKVSILKVAATVSLITIILWWWFRPSPSEVLFAKFFQATSEHITAELNNPGFYDIPEEQKRELKDALLLYNENQFKDGLLALKAFKLKYPSSPYLSSVTLYQGISALALHHYSDGIIELQNLIDSENEDVYLNNLANWYLALGYLHRGELEKTKTILNKISGDQNLLQKADSLLLLLPEDLGTRNAQ